MSGGAPIRFKDIQERGEWAQVYTRTLDGLIAQTFAQHLKTGTTSLEDYAEGLEPDVFEPLRALSAAEADAYTQAMRARGGDEIVAQAVREAQGAMQRVSVPMPFPGRPPR